MQPGSGFIVQDLRLFIRDSLFTKKVCKYRVMCPNRILGLSLRPLNLCDSKAKAAADLGANDPVHPEGEAYVKMAAFLVEDWTNVDAKYTNPPASTVMAAAKRPRVDLSQLREDWVRGCPATLIRKEPSFGTAGSRPAYNKRRGLNAGWQRPRSKYSGRYSRGGSVSSGGRGNSGGYSGGYRDLLGSSFGRPRGRN
jgi:hypothetical protein